MVRAWRGLDHFEGRAALRAWLYRIATQRLPRHDPWAPAPGPAMDSGPS